MKTQTHYELPEMEAELVEKMTKKTNGVLRGLMRERCFFPIVKLNDELNSIIDFVFGCDGSNEDADIVLTIHRQFEEAKTVAQQQSALKQFVDFKHKELAKELLVDAD
jgi:hypothetical protein